MFDIKYSLHNAWRRDDLSWHEMFFTTFFKHDLTNTTKKEKKRRKHTPKKAQEKPIVLTDATILNNERWLIYAYAFYCKYDSQRFMLNKFCHCIDLDIYLQMGGDQVHIVIWTSRYMKALAYERKIKCVCLHCQVTVVFRSVVTC